MATTLIQFCVVPVVATVIAILISPAIRRSNNAAIDFMNGLPTIGQNKGWFMSMRTRLASVLGTREMAAEGYNLHSVRGKPFVLPSLGSGSAVILPPEKLDLLNKPDKHVGAWKFQIDVLQPKHTIGSPEYYELTMKTAFAVVHKKLSRNVEGFASMVFDELSAGFQEHFGTSEEWRAVNVFDAVSRVTVRAANRIFFGSSLSDNNEFLEDLLKYITSVFQSAGMIAILPSFLRSLLGPLLSRQPRQYVKKCKRSLEKHISQRIDDTKAGKAVPDDLMQWLIEEYRTTAPHALDADHVSQSLLVLSIQSAFGTSFTLTNCILDLYSSLNWKESVESLREETGHRLFRQDGETVNVGKAVDRLYRIDSVLRESMRVSSFSIVSLFRSIDSPVGVTYDVPNASGLNSSKENVQLPQGTRIGFPQQAIHHDDSYYADAKTFDPFRFSRPFETRSIRPSTNKKTGEESQQQEPVHHINQHFLTWGYGRHACPGRIFASNIMRLALAYVIDRYDVQGLTSRPPSKPMLNTTLPPADVTIQVRSRPRVD